MSSECNPVSWFEIYVSDMDRAKAFYEAVFKVTLSQLPTVMEGGPEMWAWPMNEGLSGACGALCKMEQVEPGTGGTLVYFACEDCAEESGRVQEAGGTLVAPKFPIGEYGFIAIAKDTEDNTIGFHSMA